MKTPRRTLDGHCGRRPLLAGLALLVVGGLAGCGVDDPESPPPIRYGQDLCANCGMIISEEAHAAALRTVEGEVRLFDSVGELVRYQRRQRATLGAAFVHDYETRAWLPAAGAHYVVSPALYTPMGGGVVALGSPTAAAALAERYAGRVVGWAAVLEQIELPEVTRQRHH